MFYASTTDRGQRATLGQRHRVAELVAQIEEREAVPRRAASLDGTWRLVYASEAPYRSSPFFWAFRKQLAGASSPVLAPSLADAIFAVTDGIPFKAVGQATQTLSGTRGPGGKLESKVVLEVSVFDALLPRMSSAMTTTCSTRPMDDGLELTVLQTEVKDSSLAQAAPALLGFLDSTAFKTRDVLGAVRRALRVGARGGGSGGDGNVDDSGDDDGSDTVAMRSTLFGGGAMRVATNPADGQFFVWARTADAPDPRALAQPPVAAADLAASRQAARALEAQSEAAEYDDGMPDA